MTPARQAIANAASFIRARIEVQPTLGIVLGSGLMQLTSALKCCTELGYAAIPGFPQSRVKGHQGTLYVGRLGSQTVACLAGRVHGYEGHMPERIAFGVRVLAALGCRIVILTNAAGSVSAEFPAGSLMLIADHLNLTGNSPLVGWYEAAPQFIDMTNAYDGHLRKLALDCARTIPVELKEGVYAGLMGPSYETPAEVQMLARLGAHAVGMSTVYETIALRDLGVRVIGVSCITNAGAGMDASVLDHEHVQKIAQASQDKLRQLLVCIAERLVQRA
jgi:purine-nucleoside phosphorylase